MESNYEIMEYEDTVQDETSSGNDTTVQDFYEYQVYQSLWIYISPILLALGTVGNLLSILVLSRRAIWRLSTSPYFLVLAVADLCVLYSGLLRRWLSHLYQIDIRTLSDVGCRIHVFCVYASLHFSTWVLVLVTLSRFISVCFPLKAKSICTRRKSKVSILIAFICVFVLNSHELICRELHVTTAEIPGENETKSAQSCVHISPEYEQFFRNVWPWIDLAVSSGVPFATIIFCNSCIVWKVIVSDRLRKSILSRGSVAQDKRVSSMTAVLLVINTVFLVTTAPARIYLIGSPSWHEGVTPHEEAVLLLAWAAVNLLMYLNNSVNFILYCVAGHQFRNEFKALMCGYRLQIYPVRAQLFVYPSNPPGPGAPLGSETRRNAMKQLERY